jgi:hypothetical protein
MTETTKTAEPIWKRQPTTWKVADIYGPDLVEDLTTGWDVVVVYTTGAKPCACAMTVDVIADLDGFYVNAFGRDRFMGADLLPLGARGMGETVPNRFHPVDPEWLDDIRPRLAETIQRAAAVVRAHRDGTVCPREQAMLNGTAEITRKCLRPAGHVEDHTDVHVTWNEAGEKTS